MRYFTSIGKGDGAFRREIRFEERKDGLYVHLRRSEEDYQEGHAFKLDVAGRDRGHELHILVDDEGHDLCLNSRRGGYEIFLGSERIEVDIVDERELLAKTIQGSGPKGPQEVRADMPGVVVSLDCEVGQAVEEGQTLLILEAMKMQNPISSESAGKVAKLHVEAGQAVAAGDLLLTLE
jgi:acetyl/propionyl-CoA carboxylase alpha subunit